MEYENKYGSNGKCNLGVTLGAIGTGLGVLNGGIGGILGNIGGGNAAHCSEDHVINRYEAAQAATISELRNQISLRDANTYTDQKLLDLYRNIDGRFAAVEAQICQQNVVNAQVTANLSCMQANIATLMSLTKTVIPIDSICPTPAVAATTT